MTVAADNATDTSISETKRRRWTRWIRLPSFAFCCCTALLACIVYVGWIIVDAQYPLTAGTFLKYTVATGRLDLLWDRASSWDHLGPRLHLFTILTFTLIASSLLLILQFLRQATIRRMMLTVLVLCAWLSLWASYGRLYEWGAIRRMRSALPRFELAADAFSQHWPTEKGSLPEIGVCYAPTRALNLLWVPKPERYPIREDFGPFISRSDKGAIRFRLLDSTHRQIEFHPDGSVPTSYTTPFFGSYATIDEAVQLKDHWYFVRYGGPTIVNPFVQLPSIASRSTTNSAITASTVRIQMYMAANGEYPENLSVLPIRNGYANRTTDGWGRTLIYDVDAEGIISLKSLGRDGKPGGEGDDADIIRRYRTRNEDGSLSVDPERWIVD